MLTREGINRNFERLTPLKLLMQTSYTSSKVQYNVKVVELYSCNEQAFTFQLQHYSKLRLILPWFGFYYTTMIFSASAI